MIFNTRFYVDKEFNRHVLLKLMSEWLSASDDYFIPDIDFDFSSEDFSISAEDGSQKLIINNYPDRFIIQLSVKSETEGAVYTTYFVLDDVSDKPSLHVSQNKSFSAVSIQNDKKIHVRIPNVIRSIFWNEYGGDDNGIITDDKPLILRKDSIDFIADILSQKIQFLNPIVYVSACNNSGIYDLNINKVASELAGQAHVIAEGSPLISKIVRQRFDDTFNLPYNGAVKVIFPGGESKIFYNRKDINSYCSFDYYIINSVRRIMASVAVEPDFNYIKLRQKHMLAKLSNGCDKDLSVLCEQMLAEKDQEIALLNDEIRNLRRQVHFAEVKADTLQNQFDNSSKDTNVCLAVSESEVYQGEISNIILKILQKEYNMMTDDPNLSISRKYDVIKDLLEHNFPCTTDTGLIDCIRNAFRDGSLTREGIGCLRDAGFVVDKGGSHYKIYKNGFEKYMATVSITPSDKRCGGKNAASDFCNMLFGY